MLAGVKPLSFSVPGPPVPQPRARVTAHVTYTPDNGIHAYRAALALAARAAGATPTTRAPLTLVVDFVFTRPKSHYAAGGKLKPTALATPPADLDNLVKGLKDALNKVAYRDDRQVGRVVMEKTYGTEARTTVRIS